MQQTQDDMTQQAGEVSLRDYIDLLRRRKRIFIQTFVVVLTLGAAITFATKPMYRAETRLLVEGRAQAMAQMNSGDPLSNLFMPDVGHDVPTVAEVIQGDKVLTEAYRAANVPGDQARVDVKPVQTTDVIEIGVNSNTKLYAERLVKALPDTYNKYVTGNTKSDVDNALNYAQNNLQIEKDKLTKAENALEQLKNSNKVIDLSAERASQLGNVNVTEAELAKTKAEVAATEEKLKTLQAEQNKEPVYFESPTIQTNPEIKIVESQIAALKTQRAATAILFKDNSPKMQEIDAQVTDRESYLKSLPATLTTTTKTRNAERLSYNKILATERANLNALKEALTHAQDRAQKAKIGVGRYTPVQRRMDDLERDIARGSSTVNALSETVLKLNLRQQAERTPTKVIASTNEAQLIAPMKGKNMAYAAAIGIILALCFALLQEFMDDRIHTPEDARKLLGVPVLGYIPMVENEPNRLLSKARGNGSLLESYRVLRSNVQFATVDTPMSSLLVTSSVPAEGKSTTAVNLAVAMALDGRRVILVDADLRRPTLHSKMDLLASPGLTNVMLGQVPLEEALQETGVPNLRVLAAGTIPPNPAELLHSHTMTSLHNLLREHADMVIFDSPPALATADSQVLSALTDGVIYIVQAGEARKSGVRHAGELLNQAHANLLGIVLNKIELNQSRDSYYGYYGYYSSASLEGGDKNGKSSDKLLPKGNGKEVSVKAVTRQRDNGNGNGSHAANMPDDDKEKEEVG